MNGIEIKCTDCDLIVRFKGDRANGETQIDALEYSRHCKYADQLKPLSFDCPKLLAIIQSAIRRAEQARRE